MKIRIKLHMESFTMRIRISLPMVNFLMEMRISLVMEINKFPYENKRKCPYGEKIARDEILMLCFVGKIVIK